MANFPYVFSPNTRIKSAEVNANNDAVWPIGWTVWTPGFTGFSVNPTVDAAKYCKIGKTLIVWYKQNAVGTSNQTFFTITGLPVASVGSVTFPMMAAINSGVTLNTGIGIILTGTTTLLLYIAHDGTGWTNSGSKGVNSFTLTYEVA